MDFTTILMLVHWFKCFCTWQLLWHLLCFISGISGIKEDKGCRDGMVGLDCFQLHVIVQKRKQSSFYLISTSYQKMKYFSIDNFTDFEYYLNIQKNEESHHCLNNSSVVSLSNVVFILKLWIVNYLFAVWITLWLWNTRKILSHKYSSPHHWDFNAKLCHCLWKVPYGPDEKGIS